MGRSIVSALSLIIPLSSAAFAAGSAAIPEPAVQVAEPTPEQRAIERYNSGLANRDDAWKLENKLASAEAGDRAKLTTKIERSYKRALEDLTVAVETNPQLHQAWSSLGYVKRRSGDLQGALAAYDRALEIEPGYAEALEYRAEAYLMLGRIEEAKSAHDALRQSKPELADELLGAMRSWVAVRRTDAEIKVGQLDELERWIDAQGRGELSSASSLHKQRGW